MQPPMNRQAFPTKVIYILHSLHEDFRPNCELCNSSELACHVGDWVDVSCDYSPCVCSEGGTGVVVPKNEGEWNHIVR